MAEITCPHCRRPVPADLANSGRALPCRGCSRELMLDLFPAAQRSLGTASGALVDGSAACFFHDEKPAQSACDGCGRFVCALCDIPVGHQHLCPECLQARNRGAGAQTLANRRVTWDRAALMIAVLPILMWIFTIVTAPLVLFLVVRFWRAPNSLVSNPYPRFIIAAVLAVAQLVGWGFFVVAVVVA